MTGRPHWGARFPVFPGERHLAEAPFGPDRSLGILLHTGQ